MRYHFCHSLPRQSNSPIAFPSSQCASNQNSLCKLFLPYECTQILSPVSFKPKSLSKNMVYSSRVLEFVWTSNQNLFQIVRSCYQLSPSVLQNSLSVCLNFSPGDVLNQNLYSCNVLSILPECPTKFVCQASNQKSLKKLFAPATS